MRQRILLIVLMVGAATVISGESVLAQSEGEDEKGSHFKYDPFFYDSFNEMLGASVGSDTTRYQHPDSRKNSGDFILSLNSKGIDYENAFEAGPYNSNSLYSMYPNLPMIHFNRVNALFLGIKKERMQWYHHNELLGIPNIQLHGHLGYATGQREWQYSIGLEKLIGKNKHLLFGGEYHRATTTNDAWRVGLNETSLTAITAGYDYLDYYKQQGWGTYLLFRTDRLIEGGVSYNNAEYTTLNRATRWSMFGPRANFRINPPIEVIAEDPIKLAILSVSASFNPKQLVLSRAFTFSANAMAEFAAPELGRSEFGYSKYTTELKTHINFEPGGIFKHRLQASTITGQAPLFKQLYAGGVGTLRALPYKSLSGNQMLLSNAEILFGTPLDKNHGWIDLDDFYLSLFLDSGWVDYKERLVEAQNPLKGKNGFSFADLHHNGGLGAGSNLIRAEVAWDFNEPDRAPVLWIRFNPTF